MVQCEKWKAKCNDCPIYTNYPATRKDSSSSEYEFKKDLFTSVKTMVIVTPSQWLADLVEQSYLRKYPLRVIFNGIDLEKFHFRNSEFRNIYNLRNKFIVLGVASLWEERKGQDRFEYLAESLDDRFKVVMVGVDKKNVKSDKIICIRKTDNQEQLAEIYSTADVFLNPTREDNFPTVNIEALACGTPVLSYGAGGSAEAFDEKSGMIVSDETIIDILDRLYNVNFKSEDCIKRGKEFEQRLKFQEYVELYNNLLNK
jgi:glycosyltransferase involved in cell wall biosynthesis